MGTLESAEQSEATTLLAEVGGVPITLAEYQRRLRGMGGEAQRRTSSSEGRRQLLEAIVALHLFAAEAVAEGLATDPGVAWAGAVALRDVVVEREANARVGLADVGEDAVAEYHYAHTYRYNRPEERNLRLLITADSASAQAAVDDADIGTTASVSESLTRFRDMALERSLHPDLVDIGFVTRATLSRVASEAVVDAAFALDQAGSITQPLPVSSGFAVIQLVEERHPIQQSLEAAAESIRDAIVEERREAAAADVREAVRESAVLQVDEALLGRLEAAAPPAPSPPPWVGLTEFMLNSRLTPGRDLTMLAPLLRAAEAPAPGDGTGGDESQQP